MRIDRDSFKEILDTLLRGKSRTLLTGFGIFWGLFMLLVMLGGGHGLKSMLSANFEGFATNTVILRGGLTTKPWQGLREGRWWTLSYRDVDRLRLMVPELDVVTPVVSSWGITAIFDNKTANCTLKGVKADYAQVESPKIRYGRYLNEVDVLQERKVCVIGKRIYEALFPTGEDPCGTYIQAGSLYYQIVGVDFNAGNFSINGSADETVIIPLPVAQKILRRGNNVDLICLTGKKGVKMSTLNDRIRNIVAREHRFDPGDEQALFSINTEQIFSMVDNLFRGLNFLILLVGLGTLLAGAIGVSNIMMVTVRERTTEIGIRRAIGATPRDILLQIMLESITLTVVAGMFGIVVSVLVLAGADALKPDAGFQIGFWTAIGAALLLAGMGVLAGLAPASRAMAIKPVDAMRDE
ncbi:MAG: ABC transporter permease [Bacteroidales bacterium]|nr:ABC transporter permease [Bacteroidales bacterium]